MGAGDVKLYKLDGTTLLFDCRATQADVEHTFNLDPIIYPLPKEDSGSFDISMNQDDVLTITGVLSIAAKTTSDPMTTYQGLYNYCKYPPTSSHMWFVWDSTSYWVIPKSINFSRRAGQGTMMTYKIVLIHVDNPN